MKVDSPTTLHAMPHHNNSSSLKAHYGSQQDNPPSHSRQRYYDQHNTYSREGNNKYKEHKHLGHKKVHVERENVSQSRPKGKMHINDDDFWDYESDSDGRKRQFWYPSSTDSLCGRVQSDGDEDGQVEVLEQVYEKDQEISPGSIGGSRDGQCSRHQRDQDSVLIRPGRNEEVVDILQHIHQMAQVELMTEGHHALPTRDQVFQPQSVYYESIDSMPTQPQAHFIIDQPVQPFPVLSNPRNLDHERCIRHDQDKIPHDLNQKRQNMTEHMSAPRHAPRRHFHPGNPPPVPPKHPLRGKRTQTCTSPDIYPIIVQPNHPHNHTAGVPTQPSLQQALNSILTKLRDVEEDLETLRLNNFLGLARTFPWLFDL